MFYSDEKALGYGDGRSRKLGEGFSKQDGLLKKFAVSGTAAHTHGKNFASEPCPIAEFGDESFVYEPATVKAVLQREGLW
jgi:hypothetical protein